MIWNVLDLGYRINIKRNRGFQNFLGKKLQKKIRFLIFFLKTDFNSFCMPEPMNIICEEKNIIWSELIPDYKRFRYYSGFPWKKF